MWRYTSIADLVNIITATVICAGAIALALVLVRRFEGFSRSVLILDALITLMLIGGIRLLIRVYIQRTVPASFFNPAYFPFFNPDREKRTRLLIVGAGDAAEKMLREIQDNPRVKYRPVGFLDDNPRKQGQAIHGVPVLGAIDDIGELPIQFDEILIAIPSARGDVMRRIVEICDRTGKRFRTIPKIGELIEGRITVNTIREVRLEDLVGRQEVRLDPESISRFLCGKRILVTGAGGSIGSELVRQISRFQPQVVGLLDFSELNLFQVEQEFQLRLRSLPTEIFLTDIRDRDALQGVLERFKPHIIFHAAAYKHVPMQENHPREAVLNNVLGTRNLVDLALEMEVEGFVLVSTDKAVRPTNVMGATKRVAELFVESMNGKQDTRFVAVRFGNVFSSSGSAIPIFQAQIAQRGARDGDPSRCSALLHEHSRGGAAHPPGGGHGERRRDFHPRHGRAYPDRRHGQGSHPAPRPGAGKGHRHRVHRPAARGKTARGADHLRRGHRLHGATRKSWCCAAKHGMLRRCWRRSKRFSPLPAGETARPSRRSSRKSCLNTSPSHDTRTHGKLITD